MARERYLVNAGEETINQNEIILNTKKEKRQNFWYYHKWHILICAVAAILVFSFIYSLATKIDPDYEVAVMTQSAYPEELLNQFESYLEQYGQDLNGDGKIVVQANNYQLYVGASSENKDSNEVMAGSVKFNGDIIMGSSMIFIMDEGSIDNLTQIDGGLSSLFADIETYAPTEDTERLKIAFSDCKGLQNFTPSVQSEEITSQQVYEFYFDNLSVFIRKLEGSNIERKEKLSEYYEQSKVLFEKMKNGQ